MARPRVEVVHVGSACRDVVPEDPRGWRLGGGVTYASLTTARLGLRTAAIVGVDATAATASELDMLREAGVDLLLVPLDEGPIFHNLETPKGRVQTSVLTGVPLPVPAVPESWLAAPGWSLVPVAGELTDAWADAVPAGAHLAVAWQGFLRELDGGGAGPPPAAAAVADPAPRRPRRGQPSRRAGRDAALRALRDAPSGRGPARHPGRRRRAAGPRSVPMARPNRSATCRPRPTGRSTRPAPATRSSPRSRPRSCDPRSSAGDGLGTGSTCASRPRPDRWSSRGRASTASRIGRPSSSVGRASGSAARSSRPRSARWARSRRPDRARAVRPRLG